MKKEGRGKFYIFVTLFFAILITISSNASAQEDFCSQQCSDGAWCSQKECEKMNGCMFVGSESILNRIFKLGSCVSSPDLSPIDMVTRTLSASSVGVDCPINVDFSVNTGNQYMFYVVEDSLPAGWSVVSTGADVNTQTPGKMKIVKYSQAVPPTTIPSAQYSYSVKPTASALIGSNSFSGVYTMGDAVTSDIVPTSVIVQNNICGDSCVSPGEVCDDGNEEDLDVCSNNCQAVSCGDGICSNQGGGENSQTCIQDCPLTQICGNGVTEGTEQCDDNNLVSGDGCDSSCANEPRYLVFVTSEVYNGNLGGVAGADAKCQMGANAAGLGGTWRAWISDNLGNSPNSRLYHSTVPYRTVGTSANGGNKIVADNWNDLIDGSLDNSINMTQYGGLLDNNNLAWTGTDASGNHFNFGGGFSSDCGNWLSSLSSVYGSNGLVAGVNFNWTNHGGIAACTTPNHLYCFQQPPPVCGNGILEVGEGCEPIGKKTNCNAGGGAAGTKICSSTCQWGACVKNPPVSGTCFLPDTMITTTNGKVMIKDIKEGDVVVSYNEASNSMESNKVTELYSRVADSYLLINGKLKVTPNHPMMVNGKWAEIGTAKVGDSLKTETGQQVILSIKEVKGSVEVYNLDVSGSSTYYAEGYLAHNKDAADVIKNQQMIQ